VSVDAMAVEVVGLEVPVPQGFLHLSAPLGAVPES